MFESSDVYNSFMRAKAEHYGKPFLKDYTYPPKATPEKWVVKKTGAKKASRIFYTKQEAVDYIAERRGKGLRKYHHKGKTIPQDYIDTIDLLTKWFNTKWSTIDMRTYFKCGFDLFGKDFYYNRFTDPRIIRIYIQRDKIKKRDIQFSKERILESLKFIRKYMVDHKIPTLLQYCLRKSDVFHLPVKHYLDNKINGHLLTWLIRDKYIRLSDHERSKVPYILTNYRENVAKIEDIRPFLMKAKNQIEE